MTCKSEFCIFNTFLNNLTSLINCYIFLQDQLDSIIRFSVALQQRRTNSGVRPLALLPVPTNRGGHRAMAPPVPTAEERIHSYINHASLDA